MIKFSRTSALQLLRTLAKTQFMFVLLSLIMGVYFIFAVPLGYTEDEPVHTYRAYHLSQGNLMTAKTGSGVYDGEKINYYGGKVPLTLIEFEQFVGSGNRHEAYCWDDICKQPPLEHRKEGQALGHKPMSTHEQYNIHFWGASYYFFLPYVPTALGMWLASVFDISATANVIIAGRFGALLAYVAMIYGVLHLLRKSRVRWLVFSVALLPGSLVLAMSPGVDMFLNATALLLFGLAVRAFHDRETFSHKLRILLYVVAVALPLYKLPYLMLSTVVLFLPIYKKGWNGIWWRTGIAAAILIPSLYWSVATIDMAHTQAVMTNDGGMPDFGKQLHYVLQHPITYLGIFLKSMFSQDWLMEIGTLTQQRVRLPDSLTALSYSLMGVAGLIGAREFGATVKQRLRPLLTFLGIGLIGFVGIASAMYISYTRIGGGEILGVQGRYFIPLLPFIFLGFGLLLRTTIRTGKTARIAFYAAHIVLLLLAAGWYHYKVYIWV